MKKILNLFTVFALAVAVFTSCETYGDPEVGHSAVAPLDGRWICLMYDYDDFKASGEATATPLEYVEVWASNTTDNVSDKMWHNMVFPLSPAAGQYPYADALSIKIDCAPKSLSFSASAVAGVAPPASTYSAVYGGTVPTSRTVMTGWKATITEAKVIRNGWETSSSTPEKKYYTDKISYAIEFDHPINGVSKFQVIGNRYTLWEDDYVYITNFINAYLKRI